LASANNGQSNGIKGGKSRAFIAIDLPDETKERIYASLNGLPEKGITTVSKDVMHITLFFLGDIDGQTLESVKTAIERIDYHKFYAAATGIGAIDVKNPKVLYAKISDGAEDLIRLYDLLLKELQTIGIKREHRKYLPHITVARAYKLKDRKDLKDFIKANSYIDFGRFLCESVRLKSSVLTSSGPMHSDLYVKYLK
jgi:RNA 2',3'-cyclic 3'-phosphodiesterase